MATRTLGGGGFGFWLDEREIAPTADPAWRAASDQLRARFRAEAGRVAARLWDASRAAGLDKDGKPLRPIHALTVADRATDTSPVTGRKPYSPMGRANPAAAPLTATGAASRTRSYLRWQGVKDRGVWFYHKYDPHTRRYWGEILRRHAAGFNQRFRNGYGHVPARDVLGFSDHELDQVRAHMDRWWIDHRPRPRPKVARDRDRADQLAAPAPGLAPGVPLRARPTTRQILAEIRATPGASEAEREAARRRAGRKNLDGFDFHSGDRDLVERAMREGEFSGWATQTGRPKGGWLAGLKPITPPPPPPLLLLPGPGPNTPGIRRPNPPGLRPTATTTRPIRFGPSRATVAGDAQTVAATERLKQWLGPNIRSQDLASLIGAPSHARVSARVGFHDGHDVIFIDGEMPEARAFRRFVKRLPDGSIAIHNDTLKLDTTRARKGLGLLILGRQVENAARLGVRHLDCWAFRGSGWNGYYTWFDYGYDAPIANIPRHTLARVRSCPIESVRTATKMSDIFRTIVGRKWWSTNGDSVDPAVFSLDANSYSRAKLEKTIRRQIRRRKMKWEDLEQ